MDPMPTVRTCISHLASSCFGMLLVGSFFVTLGMLFVPVAHAQEAAESVTQEETTTQGTTMAELPEFVPNTYALGEVLAITKEGTDSVAGFEDAYQIVLVKISSGQDAGTVVTLEYHASSIDFTRVRLQEGDPLILVKSVNGRGVASYNILERFRLPVVVLLGLVFALLAIVFGRRKGLMSLIGLGVSLVVLVGFVVPHIVAGDNPVFISALGSLIIALTSLFLAHGFTRRTVIAFSATLFVLVAAFVLSHLSVIFAMLSGANSEEAVYLQMSYLQNIDLRGLLLGGLVIGVLGVLDDVTTAQVAAVEEIFRANTSLNGRELYKRGISVGREHIASLVNTLALAYVGASFPLFLLFSMPDNPPLWVIMNGESLAVEMLRAFIGGSALILAVPVSTALAAWACEKGFMRVSDHGKRSHAHHH